MNIIILLLVIAVFLSAIRFKKYESVIEVLQKLVDVDQELINIYEYKENLYNDIISSKDNIIKSKDELVKEIYRRQALKNWDKEINDHLRN
jgi:hypothetical protein